MGALNLVQRRNQVAARHKHLAAAAAVLCEGGAQHIHQRRGVEVVQVYFYLPAGLFPDAPGSGHRLPLYRVINLALAPEQELLLHTQTHIVDSRLLLVVEIPAYLLVAQLHALSEP